VIDPVADVSVCNSFTLPAITGTGLSGNQSYYSGLNGTGTQFNAGNIINNSTTLYIFDENTNALNCNSEEQFIITIVSPPVIDAVASVSICNSFTLPAITGTGLSGNQSYYSGLNGTGTQFNAGSIINNSTTLYIFDENTNALNCNSEEQFTITIAAPPVIDPVADVLSGCEPLSVNFSHSLLNVESCLWEFGDGFTSTSCGFTNHVFQTPGIYGVTLNVTLANGCTGTFTETNFITVYEVPVADFTFSPKLTSQIKALEH
jgi:PKD repeat protein